MAFNAGEVVVALGAEVNAGAFARYDALVRRAASNAQDAERRSRGMGMALGAAGLAAKGATLGFGALGAAMVYSAKKAMDFESQLSALGSVSNASAKQMEAFRKQALKAGADTKFSALEAARAQTELAKGGLSVANIMKGGLDAALSLAAAGEMDLAKAAETTANAMNLFGLRGTEATHVADSLAHAANTTTADVGDFAMALTQGGAAAKSAGLSFDETVAALESLALAGVKGSDAGTSLKAALSQIANPSKESAEMMGELGLRFFDAQGKIKPLGDVAEMLRTRLRGLTNEQRLQALQTIAGTDGFRALMALYDAGGEKVRKLADAQHDQGEAARVAAERQDNVRGKLEQLSGSLETAAITIGQALLPAIGQVAEDFTNTINSMSETGQLERLGASFASVAEAAGQVSVAVIDIAPRVVAGTGDAIQALAAFADRWLGIQTTIIDGAIATGKAINAVAPGGDIVDVSGLEKFNDRLNDSRENLRALAADGVKGIDIKLDADTDQAVAALKRVQGTKLEAKVMRVLGSDDDAKTKIKRLQALGLKPKTAQLLANAAPALAGVRTAQGAINSLQGKSVTVTVTQVFRQVGALVGRNLGAPRRKGFPSIIAGGRAAGRAPGRSELAVVGEGSDWRGAREAVVDPVARTAFTIDAPTLADLPASAYVIPQEARYRSNGLELLRMLAGDLGLDGFAKGRKPAKRSPRRQRPIPSPAQRFRASPEELDRIADNARERVQDAERTADEKDRKGRLTEKARRARGRLPELRREAARRREIARAAQRYAEQISAQEDLVDIARNDMVLADRADDQKGFDAAKKRRAAALARIGSLLAAALKSAPKGSAWARDLAKRLGQAQIDLGEARAEQRPAEEETATERAAREAAERLADTGLTDGERGRLEELERDRALAALTADLGDDRVAQQAISGLLEGLLGAAPARGVSAAGVRDLADRVAQERSNLASLTGGAGAPGVVNANPDLQAQLDQLTERNRVLAEDARINRQVFEAMRGIGDIGSGTQVVINTLHPGSPDVARAVAEAANAGNSYGPTRTSPRTRVA